MSVSTLSCVISWMFCVPCVVLFQCDCAQVIAFRSKFVTLHINSSNDDGIVVLAYVECIVPLVYSSFSV